MKKNITLPNGKIVDNYSEEYMFYCEAITIAKWDLKKRQNFLFGLQNKGKTKRVDGLKNWLIKIILIH